MVASTSRMKKTLARSLQHKTQTNLDQQEKVHRGDRTWRHTRKYGLLPYQPSKVRSCWLFDPTASGKRPAIVCCSHRVSEKHRERQKGSGELDESAPPSPQRIIAFFGDTNYINHVRIAR